MSGEIPNYGEDHMSFERLDRDLQELKQLYHSAKNQFDSQNSELEEKQAQLEAYRSGNECALGENLTPPATKEDLAEVERKIVALKSEIEKTEKYLQEITQLIDQNEMRGQRLWDLSFKRTDQPNPDDHTK